MQLDKETVKHVAEVARITLTDKEIEEYAPQLREILEAFSKLDEIDAKDTKPSFQPIDIKNAMREDEIKPSLSQEEALKNSPNTKDGYFKGPRAV
jgi:aspartyl-tRNA(Asn)/glutamyl-tRNA(Gln) amidotransferase subunit C